MIFGLKKEVSEFPDIYSSSSQSTKVADARNLAVFLSLTWTFCVILITDKQTDIASGNTPRLALHLHKIDRYKLGV